MPDYSAGRLATVGVDCYLMMNPWMPFRVSGCSETGGSSTFPKRCEAFWASKCCWFRKKPAFVSYLCASGFSRNQLPYTPAPFFSKA